VITITQVHLGLVESQHVNLR